MMHRSVQPVALAVFQDRRQVLNAKGKFVGLALAGMLDEVVADGLYDASINRTIPVDSRFMLWTIDRVGHADRLLKEMGVT